MKRDLAERLRAILRSYPEGLPVTALMDMTGQVYRANVHKSLHTMPDAFIDRWEPAARGSFQAVWCVITPPDHCPHPTKDVVAVYSRRRKTPNQATQATHTRKP